MSTGAYSPLTTLATGSGFIPFTADVVASNGQWWAVWSEPVGAGGEFAQRHMGNTDRVMIAERAGLTWTTTQLDTVTSRSPRVLAQATRARVVYLRLPTNPGTLALSAQT
jgi:hypothetical protein